MEHARIVTADRCRYALGVGALLVVCATSRMFPRQRAHAACNATRTLHWYASMARSRCYPTSAFRPTAASLRRCQFVPVRGVTVSRARTPCRCRGAHDATILHVRRGICKVQLLQSMRHLQAHLTQAPGVLSCSASSAPKARSRAAVHQRRRERRQARCAGRPRPERWSARPTAAPAGDH